MLEERGTAVSEFLGKRLVRIELSGKDHDLPPELCKFQLDPVEGQDALYELPYCSLNSPGWSTFEQAMHALKVKGKSTGWHVVSVQ